VARTEHEVRADQERSECNNRWCWRYTVCATLVICTAQANQDTRTPLGEFGLSHHPARHRPHCRWVPELIGRCSNELTGSFRLLAQRTLTVTHPTNRQTGRRVRGHIKTPHRASEAPAAKPEMILNRP
jgi:hypothetical protein